jgi:alpha-beta hydrolase superfamily lysophospholipase
MNHSESTFEGHGKLQLFFQKWQPATEKRAVFAIVHGFGEHSGRYMNVVNHLVPLGFTVYGFDHRGHGRSPGKRGHIMGWNEFREDVKQFIDMILQEGGDKPLFLYGHSMGGLIVLDYVLHYPEALNGVIASGPVLAQPGVSPLLLTLSRILSKIWPSFSIDTQLDTGAISRDSEVIKAYGADPLVHGMASARFGTELTATIKWTHDHAFELKIPLLLLHGEADKLAPPSGSRKFFENVNLNDKEYLIYPGGYHEPHNDTENQNVLNDLKRWLQKHL